MRHILLAALCTVLVSCNPHFDINLDDQPEQRWLAVGKHYKNELVGLIQEMVPYVNEHNTGGQDGWIKTIEFDPEYERELTGFVRAVNHPEVSVSRLKWLNMLYEIETPFKFGCAAVLWAMPNGTTVMGRNLDLNPSEYPRSRWRDWSLLAFDATLHKSGKPVLSMTQFPGSVGVHTGMRYASPGGHGWSFAHNRRKPYELEENPKQEAMDAAMHRGQVFSLGVRRIMETTSDYNTALQALSNTRWIAPQYFILSGGGPFEGAVLTVDRMGIYLKNTPPLRRVGNGDSDWRLVQTNDDALTYDDDGRRRLAESLLAVAARDFTLSEDNMLNFMHTPKILHSGTIFSTVMVPATGYYKTVLPHDFVGGESLMQAEASSAPVNPMNQFLSWDDFSLAQTGVTAYHDESAGQTRKAHKQVAIAESAQEKLLKLEAQKKVAIAEEDSITAQIEALQVKANHDESAHDHPKKKQRFLAHTASRPHPAPVRPHIASI